MLALYATAVLLCLCNSRVRGLLGWLPPSLFPMYMKHNQGSLWLRSKCLAGSRIFLQGWGSVFMSLGCSSCYRFATLMTHGEWAAPHPVHSLSS
jgi:hypothetical protein